MLIKTLKNFDAKYIFLPTLFPISIDNITLKSFLIMFAQVVVYRD